MKLIRSLLLSSLLLTVIYITGCSEKTTTSVEPGVTGQQLAKFTLPINATLVSGTLFIYLQNGNYPGPRTVNVYGNTGDWDEATVNTVNRPAYDPIVEGTFSTDGAPGWKEVNITNLVQKWFNCDPNYGLLLNQLEETAEFEYARYSSKEGSFPEYLEIVYSIGGVEQPPVIVPAIADAFIWPGQATGNEVVLYTGYVNAQEKETLIKFDVDCSPPSHGCTLTHGYWKTHSKYGPAPYNNTWAQVGEDTEFFLSGQTYYEVIWTSPAGGNAYYNLSFHFIAAQLNDLNGADFSAAQEAWDAAKVLLETYTPAQIGVLKGNNVLRKKFISLAGMLGNYNEGLIGPGHCDD